MAIWDWDELAKDLATVRGDNEQDITIRRGSETLNAQAVRIARVGGSGRFVNSDTGQESRGRVVVMGGTDFDVEPGDRINDENDVLYRVVLVRPNRRAAVIAEAEMVE